LNREALVLRPAPRHPDRSISLNNLAVTLPWQFNESGQREHLEEVIQLLREAVDLRPAPHPDRLSSLNNLAVALRVRHQQIRRFTLYNVFIRVANSVKPPNFAAYLTISCTAL
jgi:hypothetical protein